MRAWTTAEMIPLDHASETFAFAGADYVDLITHSEQADSDLFPFFNLRFFYTEFA